MPNTYLSLDLINGLPCMRDISVSSQNLSLTTTEEIAIAMSRKESYKTYSCC